MNPQNGKGSKQRPMDIPKEIYDDNYDRIFGNKESNQSKGTHRQWETDTDPVDVNNTLINHK